MIHPNIQHAFETLEIIIRNLHRVAFYMKRVLLSLKIKYNENIVNEN